MVSPLLFLLIVFSGLVIVFGIDYWHKTRNLDN